MKLYGKRTYSIGLCMRSGKLIPVSMQRDCLGRWSLLVTGFENGFENHIAHMDFKCHTAFCIIPSTSMQHINLLTFHICLWKRQLKTNLKGCFESEQNSNTLVLTK